MTESVIKPISFTFQESHSVRIEIINNEPWFCLKDVCEVLGLTNSRKVLSSQVDKDEVTKSYVIDSLGREQEAAFVSEPNLYRIIFRSNKPEAKQFQDWVFNDVLPAIRKTGRYDKQPAAEPLSPNDMSNLRRLVWMMTSSMKSEGSWNSGIWHYLRAVTGRPSPYPFTVNDLPALELECTRILKITTAFNAAVYDFEKSVISRKGLQPVVDGRYVG